MFITKGIFLLLSSLLRTPDFYRDWLWVPSPKSLGINMHKKSFQIYYSVSIISTTFSPCSPSDTWNHSQLCFLYPLYLNTAASTLEISLHGSHPLFSQPLALYCVSSWDPQDCYRRLLTAKMPIPFQIHIPQSFFLNAKFIISPWISATLHNSRSYQYLEYMVT